MTTLVRSLVLVAALCVLVPATTARRGSRRSTR